MFTFALSSCQRMKAQVAEKLAADLLHERLRKS